MSRNEAPSSLVNIDGEVFYRMDEPDSLAPFMVSLVSPANIWSFISSRGGLCAGRESSDQALFPYETVDKLHDHSHHGGGACFLKIRHADGKEQHWAPWDPRRTGQRALYKNVLGNRLIFEEENQILGLRARFEWTSAGSLGIIRRCKISNIGSQPLDLVVTDGVRNLLPAGVSRLLQSEMSCLVDAYKYAELKAASGLAIFGLCAAISDKAEALEALRANLVWPVVEGPAAFRLAAPSPELLDQGQAAAEDQELRGQRGHYSLTMERPLEPDADLEWALVMDVNRSPAQIEDQLYELTQGSTGLETLDQLRSSEAEALRKLIASADGLQLSQDFHQTAHHQVNVLANIMRGGTFPSPELDLRDFATYLKTRSRTASRIFGESELAQRAQCSHDELLAWGQSTGHPDVRRHCREYLPLSFSRRHGDPSRPWNHFKILTEDENGKALLNYQGNWRDIFQNWEALSYSFPQYTMSMIHLFVNASTADGHNPYRITRDGIDWERPSPDEPWANIGYWGDHQIIYLLKLVEHQYALNPDSLFAALGDQVFTYSNVPYRIRSFDALKADNKQTIDFDKALDRQITDRTQLEGADGQLLWQEEGSPRHVGLLEKLLVPILAKLSNLVVDGGIWMNTQRPEWNDANNALVGQGLSMVTLCYLHRALDFYGELLREDQQEAYQVSTDVVTWFAGLEQALAQWDGVDGYALFEACGQAYSSYRAQVYRDGLGPQTTLDRQRLVASLGQWQKLLHRSIQNNRRADGLFHAYNTLSIQDKSLKIDHLSAMLEGQVAALASKAVAPEEALEVLRSLFKSELYRADLKTFLLYPDKAIKGFLERSQVASEDLLGIELLTAMLEAGDQRIISRSRSGTHRFASAISCGEQLQVMLAEVLSEDRYQDFQGDATKVAELFEAVFCHQSFTGRSGTMFAYEGLGSVFWHMVSKLLLAVNECYWQAQEQSLSQAVKDELARHYHLVKDGFGFRHSPATYGAFPWDPHSHSPAHCGAQQPLMTGTVKEEVLARFLELGAHIEDGQMVFRSGLLSQAELMGAAGTLTYYDQSLKSRSITVPAGGLAFTWFQLPIVYTWGEQASVTVRRVHGGEESFAGSKLPRELSASIFRRQGDFESIVVSFKKDSGIAEL